MEQDWRQRLYDEKAAELLLYGRALGLGESEAEDVLQETFVALLKLKEAPDNPVHYCVRAYRNRTLNFKRGLWRRVARELESARWFEPAESASDLEELAQRALKKLPAEQREVIVLKISPSGCFTIRGSCRFATTAMPYFFVMPFPSASAPRQGKQLI